MEGSRLAAGHVATPRGGLFVEVFPAYTDDAPGTAIVEVVLRDPVRMTVLYRLHVEVDVESGRVTGEAWNEIQTCCRIARHGRAASGVRDLAVAGARRLAEKRKGS